MLGEAEPDEFISLSTAGRLPPLVRASDKIKIDTCCHECVYTDPLPDEYVYTCSTAVDRSSRTDLHRPYDLERFLMAVSSQ
jgi:hypothetical protein